MDDGPATILGRYRLIRPIGRGGMGEVFLATQQIQAGLTRRVAIKRIAPRRTHDPRFVKLFWDEARIAMRLAHPHIVHTYDCVAEGDHHYLVQEYVDGLSLRELQEKAGIALPVGVALRIAADVASALAHAHHLEDDSGQPLGVVHRDVSPHNILVARDGCVKLIDFGIAKARIQLHRTVTGMVAGKRGYIAPEQAACEPVDGRTDVFALSVVLWELLAGRRLREEREDEESRGPQRAKLAGVQLGTLSDVRTLADLRGLGLGVDDRLAEIVEKGQAILPANRWPGAEDLAIAIERYISDLRLAATPIDVAMFLRSVDGPDAEDAATVDRVLTASIEAPSVTALAEVRTELLPAGTGLETVSTVDLGPRTPASPPAPRYGRTRIIVVAAIAVWIVAVALVLWRWPAGSPPQVGPAPPSSPPDWTGVAAPAAAAPPNEAPQVPAPEQARPDAGAATAEVAAPEPVPADPGAPADGASRKRSSRPETSGRVTLRSTPPARVYLRGRLLGRTPIRALPVPAGLQPFTFETSDGARVTRAVEVHAGRFTTASFDLRQR